MRRIGMAALAAVMLLMLTAGVGTAQGDSMQGACADHDPSACDDDRDYDQENCPDYDVEEMTCDGGSFDDDPDDGTGSEPNLPDPGDGTGDDGESSGGGPVTDQNSTNNNNNASQGADSGNSPEPQYETEADWLVATIVAIILQILANASTG